MITSKYNILKLFNCMQKNVINKLFTNPIYLIYIYKEDLALNNPQWLICHKTQPNQILYI